MPELIAMLAQEPAAPGQGHGRVPDGHPDTAPAALLHNLKHNKILHEQNVILNVEVDDRRGCMTRSASRSSDLQMIWRMTLTLRLHGNPEHVARA